MTPAPFDILLVEDNPADVRLTTDVLRRARLANQVHVVDSGDSALAFLQRVRMRGADSPGLILLDLNLPGLDGRDVLDAVREDELLRPIPVVVVTGEPAAPHAAALTASGVVVVTKPVVLADLLEAIGSVHGLELSLARARDTT